MKYYVVEICVCTECIMNGAMDIIECIESLKKLRTQLRIKAQVKVETNPCLGGCQHTGKSPVVMLNGEMIENASTELVMARVLALQNG